MTFNEPAQHVTQLERAREQPWTLEHCCHHAGHSGNPQKHKAPNVDIVVIQRFIRPRDMALRLPDLGPMPTTDHGGHSITRCAISPHTGALQALLDAALRPASPLVISQREGSTLPAAS